MGPIAQQRAKRNRNLRYAYENGRLTVQEVGANGATVTLLTTDISEHLREVYRRHGYDVNAKRLSEIERLILARHGGPVDTDDGHLYLSAALNARALSWRHRGWKLTVGVLMAWVRKWTPLVPEADAKALAERVCAGPRRFKGATAGNRIKLGPDERKTLCISTMDPCGADPEALKKEKTESRKEAKKKWAASDRRAKGMTPRSESLRALCRRHGLTESHERALRRFRGRMSAESGHVAGLEQYLIGHGVDIGACPLFADLLVSRNSIQIEDTSNHVHEQRTSGCAGTTPEGGPGAQETVAPGNGDDASRREHQSALPAERSERQQPLCTVPASREPPRDARLPERADSGERGANRSGAIEPQRTLEQEDGTMSGPDAAGGRSAGAQGPTRPSSLTPKPDIPADQDRHVVGASTAATPGSGQPRAAVTTDPTGKDAPVSKIPVCGPDSAGNRHPGDDGDDPSPAYHAAQTADTRARERGDEIDAGQLLWIAAANASPAIPARIRGADADALASHMIAMGHLSESELSWIMRRPRLGRAA